MTRSPRSVERREDLDRQGLRLHRVRLGHRTREPHRHPLAFGEIVLTDRQVPFIGLPGNPVSSFVTFLMLVRPFLLRMQGARRSAPASLALRAEFDWLQPDARREFLRARSTADGGVEIFPNQGAGVLSSAVWGDGLIDNPPQQVIRRGDLLRFLPFSALLA